MVNQAFSSHQRIDWLEQAAERIVDVLVIGGGITGAGVAREVALRGLDVFAVDKGDFASGTSSRSSKLIHGGLRYLAQGDIALVREAARERAVLRTLAPHLAIPIPMMIPTASLAGRVKMQAGLWSFEKLAGDKAGDKYQVLDRGEALAAEPGLAGDRLAGAVVFGEYLTDDARLVLETLLSAVDAGAQATNYVEVVAVEPDPVGLRVTAEDRIGGGTFVIRARSVVNAAGPWFDRVRGLIEAQAPSLMQLTRGIHLVVPASKLPVTHSVVLRSPDGRSTFVVPKGQVVYIGTTDTHYTGPAEEPGVSAQDAGYLLESVAATFEDAPGATDIIGTWSGVRPLLQQPGKSPSEISRRDEIMTGPGPVVSVAGGKLTTYRRMAERVAAEVFKLLGRGADPAIDSACSSLIGGSAENQAKARTTTPKVIDARLAERLWASYGVGAGAILQRMVDAPETAQPLGELDCLTIAEAEHMVDDEMVMTVDDLLRRRTRVAIFDGFAAVAAAGAAAQFLGQRLGWDDERRSREEHDFAALVSSELDTVRGQGQPGATDSRRNDS
ncbi:MAG: glycerol-3-phosphate dehydrogenase [Hyphomicrobiaceae bacterium]